MNLDLFRQSLDAATPPADLSIAQAALWWDGKGDWTKAHDTLNADEDGLESAWVHAYLHRKEGNLPNADYWYKRAGKTRPDIALTDEWADLVRAL